MPARTADPCSLLDAKALAQFGDTTVDPNYGEFDRCDVLVHTEEGGVEVADVNLSFDSGSIEPDSQVPTRKIGHVTIAEVQSGAGKCVRNLRLADGA